jgi:hypothetical protein
MHHPHHRRVRHHPFIYSCSPPPVYRHRTSHSQTPRGEDGHDNTAVRIVPRRYRRSDARAKFGCSPQSRTSTSSLSSSPLTGATYILRYLGRIARGVSGQSLYGASAAESTQIDYFLDFAQLCTNKDTLNKYAQIINDHLANRTVLVGEIGITIADLYVWEQIAGQSRASISRHFHTSVPKRF